jgi:hypothetical protein
MPSRSTQAPFGKGLPRPTPTPRPALPHAGVLDPHQRCVNVDPCKHALRAAGALGCVAQLAADHGHAVSDAAPTMRTVRALWKLNK